MNSEEKDKAPLFKKWRYWYVLLVVFLLLLIFLFTEFSNAFA